MFYKPISTLLRKMLRQNMPLSQNKCGVSTKNAFFMYSSIDYQKVNGDNIKMVQTSLHNHFTGCSLSGVYREIFEIDLLHTYYMVWFKTEVLLCD